MNATFSPYQRPVTVGGDLRMTLAQLHLTVSAESYSALNMIKKNME